MTFTARYNTTCPECGERVAPGDEMGWFDNVAVCSPCLVGAPDVPPEKLLGPRCPDCFTYHRGECA